MEANDTSSPYRHTNIILSFHDRVPKMKSCNHGGATSPYIKEKKLKAKFFLPHLVLDAERFLPYCRVYPNWETIAATRAGNGC